MATLSLTVIQAGVQWYGLSSLQPLPPGPRNSPASISTAAGTTGVQHHTQLIFVSLVEKVSPCWPGRSLTPDLKSSKETRVVEQSERGPRGSSRRSEQRGRDFKYINSEFYYPGAGAGTVKGQSTRLQHSPPGYTFHVDLPDHRAFSTLSCDCRRNGLPFLDRNAALKQEPPNPQHDKISVAIVLDQIIGGSR
ncbi:hypothetical protein AAY473_032063 [Plecturocebus cupreus]